MTTLFDHRHVKTVCRAVALTALGMLYFVPTYYDVNAGRSRHLLEWLWREGWSIVGDSDLIWLAFLAGFIFCKRKELFGDCGTEPSTAQRLRWRCATAGFALYLLGHRMGSLPLVALSGVFALIGLCRNLFPTAQARLFVAIASLVWVIPGLFAPLYLPLRRLTAGLTAISMGIFLDLRLSETFLMLIHNGEASMFSVTDECSGFTSLKVFAVLFVGYALLLNIKTRRGAAIFIAAVAIGSQLTNFVRVCIIVGGAHWFGHAFGMRLHDGWAPQIAFVSILLCLMGVLSFMIKKGWLR